MQFSAAQALAIYQLIKNYTKLAVYIVVLCLYVSFLFLSGEAYNDYIVHRPFDHSV